MLKKHKGRILAIAGVAALISVLSPLSTASAAAPALPDLGMARMEDFHNQTVDGQDRLFFSTVIVNVGDGPFELQGRRSESSDLMSTRQRIYDSDGNVRTIDTPAKMHYSGDGHNHWHVRDLATYELIRKSDGASIGHGLKGGYCFFDNVEYRLGMSGAPSSPRYGGCGTQSDLSVTAGLSVGWGDLYSYQLPDQYIDVTGLQPGQYRLEATADKMGWFTEKSEANNSTWTDIQVDASGNFEILENGPSAQPVSGRSQFNNDSPAPTRPPAPATPAPTRPTPTRPPETTATNLDENALNGLVGQLFGGL